MSSSNESCRSIAASSSRSQEPGSIPSSSTKVVRARWYASRASACRPGPVQSEHQEPAQPLPQRIFGDQRLDLRDRVGVVAQRNLRFKSALERQHPQLLQTRGNRHEVELISEIRESRAAPE